MFDWLKRWRQSNREWDHGQNIAWPKLLAVGTNGLTQFQDEAAQQLVASIGPIQLQRAGIKETYLIGKLPGTEADVCIYSDGAQIHSGPKLLFMAEREDYATPQALIQQFVATAHSSVQRAT